MIRYQGEIVDFQEGEPPTAALWGEGAGRFPTPEGRDVADGKVSGRLDSD